MLASSLLCFSSLVGCGGTESIPLEEFDRAYFEAVCSAIVSCPDEYDAERAPMVASSGTAACAEKLAAAGNTAFEQYRSSLDTGRIEYDGEAAARCIEAVRTTCAPFLDYYLTNDACRETFVGTVPAGGACTGPRDCAFGTTCGARASWDSCAACEPLLAIGESCGSEYECSQDVPNGLAHCAGTCVSVTFVHDVGRGGACGERVDDGKPTIGLCARGLYCQLTDGASGTCATPLAIGSACQPSRDVCARGTTCLAPDDAPDEYTCRAITIVDTAGAACDWDAQIYCNTYDRLTCSVGVCESLGSGEEGSGCAGQFDTVCKPGLRCTPDADAVAYTCQKPVPNGQPCGTALAPHDCESGYCNPTTLTCETRTCE